MDLETASAYVLTHFTVPLLAVVGVIVGAVLVRRRSVRRRQARSPEAAAPPGNPRPDTPVAPSVPAICAERGHDLAVQHDRRTGLPATIRCARPECTATWDAVPDTPPTGPPRGGHPPAPRSLRPGA